MTCGKGDLQQEGGYRVGCGCQRRPRPAVPAAAASRHEAAAAGGQVCVARQPQAQGAQLELANCGSCDRVIGQLPQGAQAGRVFPGALGQRCISCSGSCGR